jgi:hypothetical protein
MHNIYPVPHNIYPVPQHHYLNIIDIIHQIPQYPHHKTTSIIYIRCQRSTISTPFTLYITTMLFTKYIRHHSSHSAICIYTQHHSLAHYNAIPIIHQIPQYPHHNTTSIIHIRYHRSTISTPLTYITTMLFTKYIRNRSSHSAVRIYTQHHRIVHYNAIHITHQIP